MNIIIHRGLEQIGGCITEIRTGTSRVFIDLGQNLPGIGEQTTPEQDRENNPKEHEAVIYTHAHEDHVELFDYVPKGITQYIGEGGKEILLAKYGLLRKIPNLSSEALLTINGKIRKLNSFKTWRRTKPHAKPQYFMVGNIRITPFFNCHSIYDSYMFLIEVDGKRIWHTGDYRKHGYMGKGLIPTLKRYATNIDVLITEGTMLKRAEECIHEREVSRRMASVMEAFKYVVVLASATDIERLASIKESAKKAHKPWYICSGYLSRTTRIFTRCEADVSKGLFEFRPQYVDGYGDKKIPTMKKRGFVLVTGVNNLDKAKEICEDLDSSEVLLIYSAWDGYYKDPEQVKNNPRYKLFRDSFPNVVDIHTSGHADRKTIKEVIETVKPKEVICIHKEADAAL